MFKKSLSIVLSILMLASVCSFLMTSSVSAYSYIDKKVIAHDFEDETGVAQWTATEKFPTGSSSLPHLAGQAKWGAEYTADPEDPNNTVFYMWNKAYNGFSMQLGKKGANGGGEDQAISLEDGKMYTLTFKYKIAAGSGAINHSAEKGFHTAVSATVYKGSQLVYKDGDKKSLGNVIHKELALSDDNVKSFGTQTAVTAGLGEYERIGYENDTDWMTASIGLTGDAARDNIFLTISAGGSNVLGGNGLVDTFVGIYFDDICIVENNYTANEVEIAGTYVYDFKDAAGNLMSITQFGADQNTSNAGRHAWFSNTHSGSGKSKLTEDGAVLFSSQPAPSLYPHKSAAFIHKICFKDPDFQIGPSNTDVKGFMSIEAGHVYTITAKVKPYGESADKTNVKAGIGLSGATSGGMSSAYGSMNTQVLTPNTWNYVTATIDGDGTFTIDTNGSVTTDNAGRIPCVFTIDSNYILIESVTVAVAKKSNTSAIATYELNKDGVLAYANIGASGNVFSDAFKNVLKNSTEITVSPSNSANQRIPFIKVAPADILGDYNAKTNVILEKGYTYRLEVEYAYDATPTGVGNVVIGFMRTNNRTSNSWESGVIIGQTAHAEGTKSDSQYFDCTFTADDAAAGNYLMFRLGRGGSANTASVTIKSAKVTVIMGNADNSYGFTATAKRSIRAEGTVAGKYQSAGLRVRGTLTTAQLEGATEIGFAVIPSAKIASDGEKWFAIDANGNLANSNAKKVECTDKVYAEGSTYKDYQLIITGLTKEDNAKNLKDTKFTAVMYTKNAEGVYKYYYVKETSYNEVKAAYANNGTAADGNGNNY